MIWEGLDERLIFPDLKASSADEVFDQLGGKLVETGYCKDTYVDALKEREKNYPTGIELGGINFAMPHTNSEHVNEEGFAIGVLKEEPVHFCHMGTTDQDVAVNMVFMMSVKDPNAHIEVLGRMLQICQDQETLGRILKAKEASEIIQIFKEKEAELDAAA